MISRKRFAAIVAVLLIVIIGAATTFIVRQTFGRPKTITAYFVRAAAIYPGDDVRVSGVKVGTVVAIEPQGTRTKFTMTLDRDVPVPADADAVLVATNLLAARSVQLTKTSTPGVGVIRDGAVIPIERTAVPVEWDEVKVQLERLATDLGPTDGASTTSIGRIVDSAADAMGGNGDKLRETLSQLAGVARVIARGSGDIVDIIKNLQTLVTVLRDSKTEIVQFEDRLATLTSVLNGSRSDLDAALTNLSQAVGEVQDFIASTRDKATESVQRLAGLTQILADHRMDVEQILHVAPNALANSYNMYNPDTGGIGGTFVFNFSNPIQFICGAIGSIENVTAPESAKLCSQYLGPVLGQLNLNYLPFSINPALAKSASPENLIYTDPSLMPGGGGGKPTPPEPAPTVSAYSGTDNPPPPLSLHDMLLPGQAAPPSDPVSPDNAVAPPPAQSPDAPLPAERPAR